MIYGIGRNYADHAKELGHMLSKPASDSPIVFFKPDSSIVLSGETVVLPPFSQNVHYEGELGLKLDSDLEVFQICIANDLTARDKQKQAQEAKGPWALAKGFKQSCGIGNWVLSKGIDLSKLEIRVHLNGKLVQRGFTKDMLFDVPNILKFLVNHFPMQPGDIILTGTPAGVGPVVAGDELKAEIVGISHGLWRFAT